MSITFETPATDDLQAQHEAYWQGALAGLQVPHLNDGTDVSPITAVMPYYPAYRAYARHLRDCEPCGTGTLWDHCPEGDALSRIASDAFASQELLAVQN